MESGKNKRRNERHDCNVPVEGKQGAAFEGSRTVDISRDGAGLIIPSFVPVNTKMAVEIDLTPQGDPVLALGQVKWVRQMQNSDSYRVGLSFTDVKTGSKSRLKKFFK